jgi:hypothetical protein
MRAAARVQDAVRLKATDRTQEGVVLQGIEAGDAVALIGQHRLNDLGDIAIVVDAEHAGNLFARHRPLANWVWRRYRT